MAAAHLVGAQADAMKAAASNESTGPFMAFAGMNMAQGVGGMNAQNLFQMGQQQCQQQAAPTNNWTCSCGEVNTGKFCNECGKPKPAPKSSMDRWTCSCGEVNTGRFCNECGKPRPAAAADGWVCACGAVNKGKFCNECGAKNRPVSRNISVTSVAGSRRIRRIRLNFARNAATRLTMGT